ncbi:MAG: hypothetical protein V1734_06345 [Nanoarchaeota archaeon]
MNEKTQGERFAKCISLIERGYICFEDEARQLAQSPLQDEVVSGVLAKGAGRLYCDYLSLITEGQCDYELTARRLAERFKFSTLGLEKALYSGTETSKRPTIKVREE